MVCSLITSSVRQARAPSLKGPRSSPASCPATVQPPQSKSLYWDPCRLSTRHTKRSQPPPLRPFDVLRGAPIRAPNHHAGIKRQNPPSTSGILPLRAGGFLSSLGLPSLIGRCARSRRRIGRKPAHPRRYIGNRVTACRRASREQVGNEKKRFEARLHPTGKPNLGPPRSAECGESSKGARRVMTIPRPDGMYCEPKTAGKVVTLSKKSL